MGPCFSSPAAIPLGPQIGELLQLQGTFECHRVPDVTPQEEEVARLDQLARHVVDRGGPAQRLLDEIGQAVHLVEHRRDPVGCQRAADLRQREAEELEGDDLGQMALRGSNAHFGPGSRVEHTVRLAGHG